MYFHKKDFMAQSNLPAPYVEDNPFLIIVSPDNFARDTMI